MEKRSIKDTLYAQVARLGKAICSPKRLELLEILCQGEFTVERLAAESDMTLKLASAHLKELKASRLVTARREGKYIYYRLAGPEVAELWVALHSVAELRLSELRDAMRDLATNPAELTALDGEQLLAGAQRGDIVVIDVRPEDEYASAHLPYAVSMPLDEIKRRLNELPKNKPIVAYCRGPFCLMAKEAVTFLNQSGFDAKRSDLGVAEWRVRGVSLITH